jgi:predicted secreted protein
VSRLEYGVSREAREKVEGEVAAQAIARFRAQAQDYAKAFGYAGFVVRDVNVQTQGDGPSPPRPLMMARMSVAAAEAPLPTAAGTGSVTANVNGSIQMK